MNQTITVNGTEYVHTYEQGSDWLKIISPFVVAVDVRDQYNLRFFLDEDSDPSITTKLNEDLPLLVDMLIYAKV
jgi:hypothetical protein